MAVAQLAKRVLLLVITAVVAVGVSFLVYKQFDQEVHRFVEATPPLRDFRNYLRLWPHPDAYLTCEAVSPSPIPRFEAAVAVAHGKLFAFGGFIDTQLHASVQSDSFDPADGSWHPLAPLPVEITHAGVAVVGDTIWLAGGFLGDHPGQAVSDVWIYEIADDAWTPGPPLPEPRAAGALVELDGYLHYFGGSLADRHSDSGSHWTLELSDPQDWKAAAQMPGPRHHHSGAALLGKVYAMGGQTSHDWRGYDLSRVDVYDPATNSWSSAAPLEKRRSHMEPGTFVWRDRVCVSGGEYDLVAALYDIDCYDAASDMWHALPALPEPIRAPIVKPLGNSWFVAAGGTMPDGMTPTSEARMCEEPPY